MPKVKNRHDDYEFLVSKGMPRIRGLAWDDGEAFYRGTKISGRLAESMLTGEAVVWVESVGGWLSHNQRDKRKAWAVYFQGSEGARPKRKLLDAVIDSAKEL